MDEGIAGHVPRTGEILNVADARRHALFQESIDKATGYVTRNLLCMPIYNRAGEVFAVAQLLNKKAAGSFDAKDEANFQDFPQPLRLILESCAQFQILPR